MVELVLRRLTLEQEIDLLLSSSVPSFLLPALPFVLITTEMQVFSSGALENGLPPGNVQFTKIYLSKHVEELKEEFLTVKALGPGTAEEWLKGLENRGKDRRLDVARWEKWELSGGVLQMRTMHHPGETINGTTQSSSSVNSISASSSSGVPSRIPSTAESQPYGSYIPCFLARRDSSLSLPPFCSVYHCAEESHLQVTPAHPTTQIMGPSLGRSYQLSLFSRSTNLVRVPARRSLK